MAIATNPLIPGARRTAGKNGTCDVWRPASHVVCFRVSGMGHTEFFDWVKPELEAAVAMHRGVYCFADAYELNDYEKGLREGFTTWFKQHRLELAGIRVLVKSPIVKMGVSIANLALGGFVQSYLARLPYEMELTRASKESALGRGPVSAPSSPRPRT